MADGKTFERELKYELNKQDYTRLLQLFKPISLPPQKLVSYYFDAPNLPLRHRKFGLRVRIIDGKRAFLTLKHPATHRSHGAPKGFKIRREEQVCIPLTVARALIRKRRKITKLGLSPVRSLRRVFPNGDLDKVSPLGSMKMERTLVPLNIGLQLEIDHFRVYRKHFYELEIETDRPMRTQKVLRSFLRPHHIPLKPLNRSKLECFLKAWEKRR